MKQGVLLAQETECSYVIFGVDSLSVIQAINDSNTSSDYDHIVQEIQLACASFASCSFHRLKMDYNNDEGEKSPVSRTIFTSLKQRLHNERKKI